MADRNTEKLAEPFLQSGTEPKFGTLVPPLVDSGDASLEAVAGGPDLDLTAPPTVNKIIAWGVQGSTKSAFVAEAKRQIKFAMPMVGMNVLQYLLNLVAVIYVGHLGQLELAASSLATTLVNISGHIMLLALASALETFCGQAFGAGQLAAVGVHTQRAMVVLTLFCIPVSVFWWYMEPALLLMGQDEAIAEAAGVYARWLIPSLFASGLTQPLIRFYQSQSVTVPLFICQLGALVIHVPLIYVLIWPAGFGFVGAAMSASIAWWINLLLLAAYLKFSKLEVFDKSWAGWSRESLSLAGMWEFSALAVPSSIMICLEYWCFEVNVIFSGLLPNPQLQMSAFTICYNTLSLCWMVPFGISAAVSTRVANELGAGHPNFARFATRVSYIIVTFSSTIISVLLLVFRRQWASIFIRDESVLELTGLMMPFISLIALLDGFTGINAGSIRGLGHQHFGAIVNLGAYYLIGLPAAIGLAFYVGMGSFGLWTGLIMGQGTQVVLLFVRIIFATNWKEEAIRASAQQEAEQHEEEDARSGDGGEKGADSRAMSVPKPLERRRSYSLPVPMGSGSYKQAYNMPTPGSSYKLSHQPPHTNGSSNGKDDLDV